MTRLTCTRCVVLVGLLFVLTLLAACAFTSEEPPMTRIVVSTSGKQGMSTESTPVSKVALPQVVSSGGGQERTSAAAVKTTSEGEVWKPREIAARVQVILAQTLNVEPTAVPWLRYETQVDTENLVCLDQLSGDVPAIADGEALVYEHEGQEVYVVGNQGQLWVCRKKEE